MKFRDLSLLILISILIVVGVGGFISFKYMGEYNPLEEVSTGEQIDLSPNRPESFVA